MTRRVGPKTVSPDLKPTTRAGAGLLPLLLSRIPELFLALVIVAILALIVFH